MTILLDENDVRSSKVWLGGLVRATWKVFDNQTTPGPMLAKQEEDLRDAVGKNAVDGENRDFMCPLIMHQKKEH